MRTPVPPPSILPSRHGLVEGGNLVSPGSDRWESGVTFSNRGCEVVFAHSADCWIGGTLNKLIQQCSGVASFDAYNLEVTLDWATIDLADDPKARVIEAMDIGTSSALERLTEQGVKDTATIVDPPVTGGVGMGGVIGHIGTTPPPNFSSALDVGGTAADSKAAVGLVEAKLLDASDHIGGRGTIYMNPILATDAWGLLDQTDGGLITKTTGSHVIIGNFEHPVVYGHLGEVDVYLGDINVTETNDRANNEYIVQAERAAVAVWNTCLLIKQGITP